MDDGKRYTEYGLLGALAIGLAAGVLAGMAIYAAAYPDLQSQEWAAWVQAIGSVFALGVAVWVADKQTRLARKIHDREAADRSMAEHLAQQRRASDRHSWVSTVVAIIESAVVHVHQIENTVNRGLLFDEYPKIDFRLSNDLSRFRAAIAALRAIPITDLRSYDAAHGVMGLVNEAELILHYLDRAGSFLPGDPNDNEAACARRVRYATLRGLGYYVQAVSALGREPDPRWRP